MWISQPDGQFVLEGYPISITAWLPPSTLGWILHVNDNVQVFKILNFAKSGGEGRAHLLDLQNAPK